MGSFADPHGKDRTAAIETALMKDADDIFKTAAEVAKHDPIAATKLIQAKAAENPFLEPLKDVVFRRSTDGKSVMEIKDEKGQLRGVINVTDMIEEERRLVQVRGWVLTVQERAILARKYFYPSQGERGTCAASEAREPSAKGGE